MTTLTMRALLQGTKKATAGTMRRRSRRSRVCEEETEESNADEETEESEESEESSADEETEDSNADEETEESSADEETTQDDSDSKEAVDAALEEGIAGGSDDAEDDDPMEVDDGSDAGETTVGQEFGEDGTVTQNVTAMVCPCCTTTLCPPFCISCTVTPPETRNMTPSVSSSPLLLEREGDCGARQVGALREVEHVGVTTGAEVVGGGEDERRRRGEDVDGLSLYDGGGVEVDVSGG